ncbi:MAG: hypothetical protein HY554_13895 [Elusimicrobia bacterium]|nr:hypothetical protein [Elusimicrobiota bacterium]
MHHRQQAAAALLVFSILAGVAGLSGRRTLCEGFLPSNNLRIPVGDVHARGIEQGMFDQVLDRVEKVYAPLVAAKGGRLVVHRLWDNATVNASAYQSGSDWHVNMYGGLARHAAVTADGFALVACHELGHHLGGIPRKAGWATNEGGADYYSTLKCLRRVFDPAGRPAAVDPAVASACDEAFGDPDARHQCMRASMAGLSVASLFQALRPGSSPPAFSTPDPSVAKRTVDSHPPGQCRLDTYWQGALCPKPVDEDVSNAKEEPGACTLSQGHFVGLRPLCWYKPPNPGWIEPWFNRGRKQKLPRPEAFERRLDGLRRAFAAL